MRFPAGNHPPLSLPKISYVLRTCPPGHIAQSTTRDFNSAIRNCLEAILGGPVELSWKKASLPSSHGGVNLRSVALHTPVAFVASSTQCQELVGRMLGRPSGPSPHLDLALVALSAAVFRPCGITLNISSNLSIGIGPSLVKTNCL